MHPSLWNVALQTVNFLVLVWLLQRFLFKPVRASLSRRQDAIAASLRDADRKTSEADRVIREYGEKSADIAQQAARAREQAIAGAEQEAHRIRDEALRQSLMEVDRARAQIERERSEALRVLEGRAAELATSLAARLLREALPDSDASFLWRATSSIDALDAEGRVAAGRHFAKGPVETISSRPLDEPTRERFERWLSHLAGGPVPATYHVDESLIAGVELRLPTGVWRANWRESLERIKTELHARDAAA